MEEETHKLEAIIGDLLDLARLEGRGEKLRSQPVSVKDLFARVADRHAPSIRERGITLELDIAPDTPEILGDPGRLEQAVQNSPPMPSATRRPAAASSARGPPGRRRRHQRP